MKQRKSFIFIFILIITILINHPKVSASKATCTYEYSPIDVTVTYTYEYGKILSYTTSNKNKSIKTSSLNNTHFVNQETGEISCPKIKFTSKTVDKGKWEITANKSNDGIAGTLNMIVSDNKEKESPSSDVTACYYNLNGFERYEYILSWNNGINVQLTGEGLQGYTVQVQNCDNSDFVDGCPNVYDQLVAKGKRVIIDCKNKIFSDNDEENNPDHSIDVDTGKPDDDDDEPGVDIGPIRDQYIGNTSCGGIRNFTFHKRLPDLTSTAYTILKVAIPIILIVKGMIDMFKAMSAGKEDEMKKAQKKFVQRLIASICAFLVFMIVETITEWISDATDNEGAMSCVNCFINGSKHCEEVTAKDK